jgi:UDP-glucose 4-epimerase
VGGGRKGAAVRLDYADRVVPLHVDDIARAHLLALDRLASGDEAEPFSVFNLGSGRACSAREVIDAIGEVAGRPYR